MSRFVLSGMVCAGLVLVANPALAGVVTASISGVWLDGVASGSDIRLLGVLGGSSDLGIQQFGDNTDQIHFMGNSVTDQPTGQTFVLGTLNITTSGIVARGGFNTVDLVLATDSADPAFQGPSTISMKITVVGPPDSMTGDDPMLFEFAGHPELGGFLVPGFS